MQGLAQRAFAENWIDAEPRAGKRDGAFCMGLRGDESRILSNYKRISTPSARWRMNSAMPTTTSPAPNARRFSATCP